MFSMKGSKKDDASLFLLLAIDVDNWPQLYPVR